MFWTQQAEPFVEYLMNFRTPRNLFKIPPISQTSLCL